MSFVSLRDCTDLISFAVVYPTRFLEAEDLAGNFLFNSDKILPLPIYD